MTTATALAQRTFGEISLDKPRVIVLTDITNEPDDQQSLVRFLSYANEFDIEGLIATTSTWLRDDVRPAVIKKLVQAYGQVRPRLLEHAPGYPEQEYLMERVTQHLPQYGMAGVGAGMNSEGSSHIIEVVDRADERPVWVTVWGGVNCLAQALWQVRETRSPAEVKEFVSKLRVYTISDQDDSGPWIRDHFPGLWYIVSASSEGAEWYHKATWSGIAGDKLYQNGPGHKFELVDNPWIEKNIMQNHGPLGALYPHVEYIMEGDTPSYLGLIRNGLGWAIRPDFGGWGGRYQLARTYGESRPIWTNTRNSRDRVVAENGVAYVSDQATIWRWRQAYQHDFAARMDWQVTTYEEANHNPEPVVNGHDGMTILTTTARPGDTVTLTAEGSTDPDGDRLSFHWWVYGEAGTSARWWTNRNAGAYPGDVTVRNARQIEAEITIPPDYLTNDRHRPEGDTRVHIILEVTDSGQPPLTSYRRVVIDVVAEG